MAEEKKTITELTDILDQDIEAIVSMRLNAERTVSRHQRAIESVSSAVGQPLAVYVILLFIALWLLISTFHYMLGLPIFDGPPFPWLQDIVSVSALLMTVVVLTTQNRQARLAEQRRHLDLQITLLTERKVSKLVALIDELRRDLPSIESRTDPETEVMKEPVDPHTALSALNKTLQDAAREHQFSVD